MKDYSQANWLTKRFRKALRNYKAWRQKPKVWVVPDEGWVYVQIPKVASTSIARSIAVHLHNKHGKPLQLENVRYEDVVASADQYASHLSGREIAALDSSLYKFAFVRNPFDRLWSCYKNKIVDAEGTTGQNIFWSHGFEFGMSFDEFVEKVAQIPDTHINRHLKSQSFFLAPNEKLLVDHAAHLEKIDQEWEAIAARLNLPPLTHANKSSGRDTPAAADYREHFTPALARTTYERYAADVDLFGYRDAYEELLK